MRFSVLRFSLLFVSTLLIGGPAARARSAVSSHLIDWPSPITGGDLKLTVLPAENTDSSTRPPLVFYLQNLAAPRVGTDSDAAIVADLRHAGHLVVLLDYRKHPHARVPFINRDLAKLRDDLRAGKLLDGKSFDAARVYIVPSGHRLKRDIVFYREDARTLALDLIYPSGVSSDQARHAAGTVLEFSCDNKDRFGNTSLSLCSDTLLDGFATEGFAVAMADHPVAAPYKGLDAMPASAWKIKAAVRTLRFETTALGLGGKIVPAGFSRGSGMALMLLTTGGLPEFEGRGEHPGINSAVQGAVVLSGRFTYMDLLASDHMIPRYDTAWGTREAAADTWRRHGALDYLDAPTKPVFLSINITESPDALHQMTVLRKRLAELGIDETFMMEREPRGHKVPLDPTILDAMNAYLKDRFAAAKSALEK